MPLTPPIQTTDWADAFYWKRKLSDLFAFVGRGYQGFSPSVILGPTVNLNGYGYEQIGDLCLIAINFNMTGNSSTREVVFSLPFQPKDLFGVMAGAMQEGANPYYLSALGVIGDDSRLHVTRYDAAAFPSVAINARIEGVYRIS
jgi:hypothetical protein